MIAPVAAPIAKPSSTSTSPKSSAFSKPMCTMYLAAITLIRLIIEPICRSIPPEMITIAWPIAANANGSASIASDWTSNGPHGSGVAPRSERARGRGRGRRRTPVEDDGDEQEDDAERPAVASHEAANVGSTVDADVGGGRAHAGR